MKGRWIAVVLCRLILTLGLASFHETQSCEAFPIAMAPTYVQAVPKANPEVQKLVDAAMAPGVSKQEALRLLRQGRAKAALLNDRFGEGRCWYREGQVLGADGGKEAISASENALKITRELGLRLQEGQCLLLVGFLLNSLGRSNEALDRFTAALTISHELKDRRLEGYALGNAGLALHKSGKRQDALDRYRDSLEIMRAEGDRAGEPAVLQNLGNTLCALGRQDEGFKGYEECLAIYRESKDRRSEAAALNWVGSALSEMGLQGKAIAKHEEAFAIFNELGDRAQVAFTKGRIASVYLALGRFEEALEQNKQALGVLKGGEYPLSEFYLLNGMAGDLDELGRYAEAIPVLEEGIRLARRAGFRDEEATAVGNLGATLMRLGRHKEAQEKYSESLRITREIGEPANEAAALHTQGYELLQVGRKAEALEKFLESRAVLSELGDQTHLVDSTGAIAYTLDSLGYHCPCGVLQRESVRLIRFMRRDVTGLDSDTRRGFASQTVPTMRAYVRTLCAEHRYSEAERVLELTREDEYAEFSGGDTRISTPPPFVGREERWWHEFESQVAPTGKLLLEYDRLASRAESNLSRTEARRIQELGPQLPSLKHKLEDWARRVQTEYKANPAEERRDAEKRLSEVLPNGNMVETCRMLASGGDNCIAVMPALVGEQLVFLLASKGGRESITVNIKNVDVNRTIRRFYIALVNPMLDPRPDGKKLYDLLVAPIWSKIKGKTVIWDLTGQLQYIPMAALWDGKQYLGERMLNARFNLQRKSLLAGSSGKPTRIFGFGVSKGDGTYSALPAVDDEAKAVASVLREPFKLNDHFTESSLRAALSLPGSKVVHLATHFRTSTHLDNSTLLIGKRDKPRNSPPFSERELSVAEMKEWGNDFLKDVDLLVLSACATDRPNTNRGSQLGSFAQMATDAGARSVIGTLWNVDDTSTAALMGEFYRLWVKNGLSKAEALRRAQLAVLRGTLKPAGGSGLRSQHATDTGTSKDGIRKFTPPAGRPWCHPYYWASFVLHGNWK